MAIMFRCQNCNAKIKVPDEKSGKNGKCPKCGQIVLVPFETEQEFKDLREGEINTTSDDSETYIKTYDKKSKTTSGLQKFDQTELLRLPNSLNNEVANAKRQPSNQIKGGNLDMTEEDDDDLLFLDDSPETANEKSNLSDETPVTKNDVPELINEPTLTDTSEELAETLTEDYFKDLIVDEEIDEQTEVLEQQPPSVIAKRETEVIQKTAPTPASVKKSVPEKRKRIKQSPSSGAMQKKRKIPASKPRKVVQKIEEKPEPPAKKSGGGFFWVFFGIILALAHTITVFVLGAWFMLERVEKGKSPVDPAFKIMKFEDRLEEIDHKIKLQSDVTKEANSDNPTNDSE